MVPPYPLEGTVAHEPATPARQCVPTWVGVSRVEYTATSSIAPGKFPSPVPIKSASVVVVDSERVDWVAICWPSMYETRVPAPSYVMAMACQRLSSTEYGREKDRL